LVSGNYGLKYMTLFMSSSYCSVCGGKLFDGDCGFCLNNSNALKEFEEENE
jgi:hypothetical protein